MEEGNVMSFYATVRAWLWTLQQEKGQDLVEYALLLGLIAVVVVVAVATAGGFVSQVWAGIVAAFGIALAAL
jgi:Flp pilus assembly pilin Flp